MIPDRFASIRSYFVMGLVALWSAGFAKGAFAVEPNVAIAHIDDPVARLAATIDAHISARWQAEKVQPAEVVDDAAFLRRTSLNLVGKIPRVSEIREFLDDPSPAKRRELVDRLLTSPAYIANFTNIWRKLMIPEAEADFQLQILIPGFENWLRAQLNENRGYDQMVRELLTVSLSDSQPQQAFQQAATIGPVAFYFAKQFKPENIAAGTSRLFLGVQLECAQCHDHPFAKWQREEFWGFAAFFSGISAGENRQVNDVPNRSALKIPETEKIVQAKFLDGKLLEPNKEVPTRAAFAQWVTRAENPYFSRAAANRIWAHFFGAGIVVPVDNFDANNSPSHPKLLDELAREFAAQKFDVKFLIRSITASKAYQLSSRLTHASQSNPRLFARMKVKGLSPEQLFDSLATATGFYEYVPANNRFAVGENTPRARIRELFATEIASNAESQTSILQALALMNGKFVADATSLERSTTLAAVVDSPFFDTSDRVETLYLAALGRKPRPEEFARSIKYVESGGPKEDATSALADLFWALLNSSEFILNH